MVSPLFGALLGVNGFFRFLGAISVAMARFGITCLLMVIPFQYVIAQDITVSGNYLIDTNQDLVDPDTLRVSGITKIGSVNSGTLFSQTGGTLEAFQLELGQSNISPRSSGFYTLSGGTANISSSFRAWESSQLRVEGGSLFADSGFEFFINSRFIVDGGLVQTSRLTLNNSSSVIFNAGEIDIGSFEQRSGSPFSINGASVRIDSYSAIDLESGFTLNSGSLSVGEIDYGFNNSTGARGNYVINGGQLTVTDGEFFLGGSLVQAAGTAIVGDIRTTVTSAVSLGGSLNIIGNLTMRGGQIIDGSSLQIDGDFDAGDPFALRLSNFAGFGDTDLTGVSITEVDGGSFENNGLVRLTGGTIRGNSQIINNGIISGGGTFSNSGAFLNNGAINQGDDNLIFTAAGGTTNYGSVALSTGRQMRINGSTFTNLGTVDLSSSLIIGDGLLENGFGGSIVGSGTISSDFVNNGSILADNGTMNIVSDYTNNGVIQAAGLAANLNGGTITNVGNIQGFGNISSNIVNQGTIESNNGTLVLNGVASNTSSGLISAKTSSQVLVLQGLSSNEGVISLTGGTFDNNNKELANDGQISGHGTLRTSGLTNNASVHLTGGTTTINGDVTNEAGSNIQVSYDAAIFTGNVINNGIFKTTDTNVTFTGSYTENGTYISDPSDNYFQDLLVGENGALIGGVGDNWHVSGDFVNNSNQASIWDTDDASLYISGAGEQLLALAGIDNGANDAGYSDNFAWGELHVGSGINLSLSDGNDEEGAALYVGLFDYSGPIDFNTFIMAAIFSDFNIYYDADLEGNSYLMGETFAFNGLGSLVGVSSVPIPAAAWLFGTALAGLISLREFNKGA